MNPPRSNLPLALLGSGALLLALSGVAPHDRATWWLEVSPILIGVPILLATARRFPWTPLAYVAVFLHACVLMLGAHYTYAQVPLGFWVQDFFEFSRNHYDRLGHVAQGFFPAILARELLLRATPLERGGWLWLLVTSVCLAISAFYELLEWWVALLVGAAADAFLATQGDVWDTQWDMFLALLGALASQASLGARHDRQLEVLLRPDRSGPA